MKIGDRVIVIEGMCQGRKGFISSQLKQTGGDFWKVEFDDVNDWGYWSESQLELDTSTAGKLNNGCECGSSAVGSPRHSYYCRLYEDYT